jgi:hypothetical protein
MVCIADRFITGHIAKDEDTKKWAKKNYLCPLVLLFQWFFPGKPSHKTVAKIQHNPI